LYADDNSKIENRMNFFLLSMYRKNKRDF